MPLVPGLSPSIRQLAPDEPDAPEPMEIMIESNDNNPDGGLVFDDKGALIKIEHEDGSITIDPFGRSLRPAPSNKTGLKWFDNLVEDIDDTELGRVCNDLMRGIEDDIQSRKEWVDARSKGIRLLGLTIELPGLTGPADGAPVEGMSRVRHPLLLEAVLRFQANARSELLPTDGPVKIRNDHFDSTVQNDQMANALEADMNHYLTAVAKEYYPDTDRMLLLLGFGGTSFKKVYFCPLRNRPVSETVDADDLIVNNSATDLHNAKRVTHRVNMKQSTIKRLQILGVYRDVGLGTPVSPMLDALQLEKKNQQGISESDYNPDDRDREIYECYCELDLKGFEHELKGEETGLEIPYRVTMDVSSRTILSIVRDYDEDTEDLPEKRDNFIKYTFVPGFGFYDIGLIHILGNTTNAITAVWRELLDAGMFASFPGFLYADTGARQNTNIFRVPPGGGALIKTGGMPIQDFAMPLPYNGPSPALMTMGQDVAQTGMRIGGTSEQQVGEGRADAPVGTTLAMIEQAMKVLNAVHKRMHAAQASEFQLLKRCFKEHPDSFWKRIKKPAFPWDQDTFVRALDDFDLVPQADPNTASHSQRIMKVVGLQQLAAASPNLFDPIKINTVAIEALGYSNPEQFFVPPSAMGKPPPDLLKAQAETMAKVQTAQASSDLDKARAQEILANIGKPDKADPQKPPEPVSPVDMMQARAKLMDAQTKAHSVKTDLVEAQMDAHSKAQGLRNDLMETHLEDRQRSLDRLSKDSIAQSDARRDHMQDVLDVARLRLDQEKMRQEGEMAEKEHKLATTEAKKPKTEKFE